MVKGVSKTQTDKNRSKFVKSDILFGSSQFWPMKSLKNCATSGVDMISSKEEAQAPSTPVKKALAGPGG